MVLFYGPDGDTVENPDEEFLKDIIFNKDEDFWQDGSGDSSLEVEGCDEAPYFFMTNLTVSSLCATPITLFPMIDRKSVV